MSRYDFIIIGGGSAGSVPTDRLSANPGHRLLVLEAGRPDHRLDFRIHVPAALTYPLAGKTYNWWYESDPTVYPSILFNYFSTEQERREWVEAIHKAREIMTQPAFDEFRGAETASGDAA